jgi:hypothetical protein
MGYENEELLCVSCPKNSVVMRTTHPPPQKKSLLGACLTHVSSRKGIIGDIRYGQRDYLLDFL